MANLCLLCPTEEVLKPIVNSIFSKHASNDIRYRVAMYFFLMLWRLDLQTLKRCFGKIEDALVYMSNDDSEAVKEVLFECLTMLKIKDESLYRRVARIIRKSIIRDYEEVSQNWSTQLKEKLRNTMTSINQLEDNTNRVLKLCPLNPKSAQEFIDAIDRSQSVNGDQLEAKYRIRWDDRGDDEASQDNNDQNSNYRLKPRIKHSRNSSQNKSINSKKKNSTIREVTEDRELSNSNVKHIDKHNSHESKKNNRQDSLYKARDDRRNEYYNYMSDHNLHKTTEKEEKHWNSNIQFSPEQGSAPNFPTVSTPEQLFKLYSNNGGERLNEDNLINKELQQIISGTGHLIPSKRDQPAFLNNSPVVVIIEDLILGGEQQDLVKLHEYFNNQYHHEHTRLNILDNILDECMYYLHFENEIFQQNIKIVLQTISEYLRRKK